jgi:hypothetical protein
MSIEMDEEIKRWTARRKSALVLDIIQGKTTVSESSRQFDLPPSEIESWIDQAKAGIIALSIYVILDLEFPRRGLIRIDGDDGVLMELRQSFD